MIRAAPAARRSRGISYVEVVVATAVLAVALVPALDALQSGIGGSVVHASQMQVQQRLRDKMEEVLVRPFGSLYAMTYAAGGNLPAAVQAELSDPAGATDRRIVNLYRVDGAAPSTADSGLLRIRVAYENGDGVLETLKGRWW